MEEYGNINYSTDKINELLDKVDKNKTAVDITDIMIRLSELAGVSGTCTDEDYNALKGYALNGTVTYGNINGSAMLLNIAIVDDIITLRYNIFDGGMDTVLQFIISSDKLVTNSYAVFLSSSVAGSGMLGLDYTKPSAYSAITVNDNISRAIGKLEAGISNGGSSDVYYLPSEVGRLSSTATSEEILTALGGSEKRTELVNAIKEKKIIMISGDGINYGTTIVSPYLFFSVHPIISFVRQDALTLKNETVTITFASVSTINVVNQSGYNLYTKINTLKSSSTSEEISSAIGGLDGILALKKAIEDGNTIYADADNSVINATDTSGRMQLSVIVSKTDTKYIIAISGVQGESYFNYFGISYLIIEYDISSDTFSCSKTMSEVPVVS